MTTLQSRGSCLLLQIRDGGLERFKGCTRADGQHGGEVRLGLFCLPCAPGCTADRWQGQKTSRFRDLCPVSWLCFWMHSLPWRRRDRARQAGHRQALQSWSLESSNIGRGLLSPGCVFCYYKAVLGAFLTQSAQIWAEDEVLSYLPCC